MRRVYRAQLAGLRGLSRPQGPPALTTAPRREGRSDPERARSAGFVRTPSSSMAVPTYNRSILRCRGFVVQRPPRRAPSVSWASSWSLQRPLRAPPNPWRPVPPSSTGSQVRWDRHPLRRPSRGLPLPDERYASERRCRSRPQHLPYSRGGATTPVAGSPSWHFESTATRPGSTCTSLTIKVRVPGPRPASCPRRRLSVAIRRKGVRQPPMRRSADDPSSHSRDQRRRLWAHPFACGDGGRPRAHRAWPEH